MSRTLLLDLAEDEERRAALLEDGRLSLLWVERPDEGSFVGNVYKGRVTRVEPAIGAAFVDVGLERTAFLHGDDVMPVLGEEDAGLMDFAGRAPSGEGPSIDQVLEKGREIVVQVTRDPMGHKGPTVTTHVSLAGRRLVLLPSLGRRAVSRRIEDPEERRRIEETLAALPVPPEMGIVARTAAKGASAATLEREAADLVSAWDAIARAAETAAAPALLREESDFVTRAVRELLIRAPEGSSGPTRIIADTREAAERARAFVGEGEDEVSLHESPVPLFHSHGIEREVRSLDEPRVELPGGAFLVIERTEALWSIDVNSGRFRKGENLEETALATDLLAATEVARQIRLRDLSGMLVVDFIDCREPEGRARVEAAFRAELAKDTARLRMAPLSEFMAAEITRRRLRTGPAHIGSEPCPACRGRGRVRSATSAGLAVLRELRAILANGAPGGVEIACSPEIADDLDDRKAAIRELEQRHGVPVRVSASESGAWDFFEVRRLSPRRGGSAH